MLFSDNSPFGPLNFAGPAGAGYAPPFEDCLNSKDFSSASSSRYRSAALAYLDGNDSHFFNPGFKPSIAGSVPGLSVRDDRMSEAEEEEGLLQTSAEEEGEIVAPSKDDSSLSGSSNKVYPIPVITTPRMSMEYDENANDVTSFKSALNNYRKGFM